MNHNTKPHFQFVIDRQRLAQHNLTRSSTTRSIVELAALERSLDPCPVAGVEIPKLPMVRLKSVDQPYIPITRWVILGEIAQVPGKLILLDLDTGLVELRYSVDDMEIVPPTELR
jgi:hypothetical protein